jgi:hypothetical protein
MHSGGWWPNGSDPDLVGAYHLWQRPPRSPCSPDEKPAFRNRLTIKKNDDRKGRSPNSRRIYVASASSKAAKGKATGIWKGCRRCSTACPRIRSGAVVEDRSRASSCGICTCNSTLGWTTALGHERRFRGVRDESALPPGPERLRQRSESTFRATCGPRTAIRSCAQGNIKLGPSRSGSGRIGKVCLSFLWVPRSPRPIWFERRASA